MGNSLYGSISLMFVLGKSTVLSGKLAGSLGDFLYLKLLYMNTHTHTHAHTHHYIDLIFVHEWVNKKHVRKYRLVKAT
jgi:hypothetical protein